MLQALITRNVPAFADTSTISSGIRAVSKRGRTQRRRRLLALLLIIQPLLKYP
jgi:hypothetical protein